MKFKKGIAIILSLIMLLGACIESFAAPVEYGKELGDMPSKNYEEKFSDVSKSYWGFSYIAEMESRGVLCGYPDGKFYPDNPVTRAEFAKIMTGAAGLSATWDMNTEVYYADLDLDEWYYPYIAAAEKYLSGYLYDSEYHYLPDEYALREDIAVALVKLKGYQKSNYDVSMVKSMFTDWESISKNALKYVAIGVEKGLISGYEDSTFRGQQGITRAEAAALLWRAYQYGNDNKTFNQTEKENNEKPEIKKDDESKENSQDNAKDTAKNDGSDIGDNKEESDKEKENKTTFICDTIAKAKVENVYQYATTDYNNTVYYYDKDDNAVYKINMKNRKKSTVLDVSDLKDEEFEITEKEVTEEVPKTITKTVEVDDDEETDTEDNAESAKNTDVSANPEISENENADEELNNSEESSENETVEKPKKKKTKEVTETVYETVTKTVEEKTLKGTYTDFRVSQLYYNTANNKLYLFGEYNKYKSEYSLNSTGSDHGVVYEISGKPKKLDWIAGRYRNPQIVGNNNKGDFIQYGDSYYNDSNHYYYYTIDCSTGKSNELCKRYSSSYSDYVFFGGNTIYSLMGFGSSTSRAFYKYNFSKTSWKNLGYNDLDAFSVYKNNLYFWDYGTGKLAKSDLDGKISYVDNINFKDDVEVLDYHDLPTSHNYNTSKFFLSGDMNIIFYDSDAGTWRYIVKRK